MARVTGIGGIFFKARGNPAALAAWYRDYLGLPFQDWGGAVLDWQADARADGGLTVWHLAEPGSDWFAPSAAPFMVNYRVDDLDGIVARLADGGFPLAQGPEDHPNGRFAWVMDPEGNRVELWEPRPWQEEPGQGS
ncbi:MAG: VOC family protein [Rhodobacteraceae bacterium]|nr:VOC family protein [Paracoccaceae bacterium]